LHLKSGGVAKMGVGDWFKIRRRKKKADETAPEPEKSEEPISEEKEDLAAEMPAQEAEESVPKLEAEETAEPATEAPTEKTEEPTPEAGAEETEELASEPTAQETEESTPEGAAEGEEALAPEAPAQEAEEPAPDQAEEGAPEELAPEPSIQGEEEPAPEAGAETEEELALEQPPSEKVERPMPSMWKLAFRGRPKKQKQTEKGQKVEKTEAKEKAGKKASKWQIWKREKKERAPEPEFFKLLILPTTLASMLLGLSIMPLFPQPLPAILAFLIAFLAYKKPRIGMPVGGLTIGLGLMYNLSKMNFIAMLGSTFSRQAFVFVLLFLFTALPVIFHSRKAVLSINLGIIAAILLFFSQTYFLAIPLIFTAVVLFKKTSFLTVIYYAFISVPLLIMQYLNLVLPIERWDWWIEPGTSPPIYVPLTQIFTSVQESMLQFRLYDTSKVVYAIGDQMTMNPPVLPHTVQEMISHYFDSLPGIIMFLFMVIGIVSALVFFSRTFFSKSNISHAERLIPMMSATIGVALFFILAAGLQGPLAFRVDVNGVQMALATFATLLFTLPTFLVDYTPKRRATVDMIMEKAKDLKGKLLVFEEQLDDVKRNLPISTGPFEVKTMMVRDRLGEVLSKASARLENASEIDEIFNEIDSLSKEIDNLAVELNVAVGEYQVFVNCEYSKWIGMFKDVGLEAEFAAKPEFQAAEALSARIDQIKEVLENGRSLAREIIGVAEEVYGVIRSFYDPGLPEENQSIAFAKKKLELKATPWIALDALFNALNNWNKQYRVQISRSIGHLQTELASIAGLSAQTEKLQLVLGDDFPRMMENVKKAENIKVDVEKRALNVVNALTMKDVFESSLGIARDVLSLLDEKLRREEQAIKTLAPSEDFLWEKNEALRKRLASAVEITSKTSDVKLGEVLESLPKFLGYVDESLSTIVVYNHTEELLLNYPVAEKAVENLLREKKRISAADLPFEPKFAEEYLRLFYSQKFREVSFDRTNMLLSKKT
jgi:hypothetical protein